MSVSRRGFLHIGGLAAAGAALSGCSAAGRVTQRRGIREQVQGSAGQAAPDARLRRLINRAGYGPTPGQAEEAAALGYEAYLDQQLDPAGIEDTACDLFIRNLSLYHMDIGQLLNKDHRDITYELVLATFLRAMHSRRHLYEAVVEFWSDHFNIYPGKDEYLPALKLIDDREAIRPHALGRFRDLLGASAHSPAMLYYLDNVVNFKDAPNENYARELLELHTLGIDGGYTQQDVQELARALSGWGVSLRVEDDNKFNFDEGAFSFNADQHDHGAKTILGKTYPAGRGAEEVEEILDDLARHPATARFISMKLARRFVADDPPVELIEQLAQTFTQTDGDIKAVVRELFLSEAFSAAPPKLKRPWTYTVSALRACGADIDRRGHAPLADWLRRMGQVPFQWPMPDGFPDVARVWVPGVLPRWNFTAALVGGSIDGVNLPLPRLIEAARLDTPAAALSYFNQAITGGAITKKDLAALEAYIGQEHIDRQNGRQRLAHTLGVMLAGPGFMWV